MVLNVCFQRIPKSREIALNIEGRAQFSVEEFTDLPVSDASEIRARYRYNFTVARRLAGKFGLQNRQLPLKYLDRFRA